MTKHKLFTEMTTQELINYMIANNQNRSSRLSKAWKQFVATKPTIPDLIIVFKNVGPLCFEAALEISKVKGPRQISGMQSMYHNIAWFMELFNNQK